MLRQRLGRLFPGVYISGLMTRGHYHNFAMGHSTADTGLWKPGERSTWVEVETSRPAVTSVTRDVNNFRFSVRVLYDYPTTSVIRLDDYLHYDVTRTHVARTQCHYVLATLWFGVASTRHVNTIQATRYFHIVFAGFYATFPPDFSTVTSRLQSIGACPCVH